VIFLGSAEAYIGWGGKLNCHLMASCVRNICTKKIQNLIIGFQATVKNVGVFETQCIIITLLQTVCRVCQWKNFKNRSITSEDMDKSNVPRFLLVHPVYLYSWKCCPSLLSLQHNFTSAYQFSTKISDVTCENDMWKWYCDTVIRLFTIYRAAIYNKHSLYSDLKNKVEQNMTRNCTQ